MSLRPIRLADVPPKRSFAVLVIGAAIGAVVSFIALFPIFSIILPLESGSMFGVVLFILPPFEGFVTSVVSVAAYWTFMRAEGVRTVASVVAVSYTAGAALSVLSFLPSPLHLLEDWLLWWAGPAMVLIGAGARAVFQTIRTLRGQR